MKSSTTVNQSNNECPYKRCATQLLTTKIATFPHFQKLLIFHSTLNCDSKTPISWRPKTLHCSINFCSLDILAKIVLLFTISHSITIHFPLRNDRMFGIESMDIIESGPHRLGWRFCGLIFMKWRIQERFHRNNQKMNFDFCV